MSNQHVLGAWKSLPDYFGRQDRCSVGPRGQRRFPGGIRSRYGMSQFGNGSMLRKMAERTTKARFPWYCNDSPQFILKEMLGAGAHLLPENQNCLKGEL